MFDESSVHGRGPFRHKKLVAWLVLAAFVAVPTAIWWPASLDVLLRIGATVLWAIGVCALAVFFWWALCVVFGFFDQ